MQIVYIIFIIILLLFFVIGIKHKLNIISCLILIVCIIVSSIYIFINYFYTTNVVSVDKNIFDIKVPNNGDMNINKDKLFNDTNLYNKFSKYDISEINFSTLKDVNSDIISWIMVDGTNINYPVVQTVDNEYYLNHDLLKRDSSGGWIFLDYRNDYKMHDSNTIFYGHNLLNGTAFGSLDRVFNDKWFNSSNHYIVVLIGKKKYIYEIFSCYYSDVDTYYLQNNFINKDEYSLFLDSIVKKSKYNFNVNLDSSDKIITLSTCTDDNNGRKVVHAKLINK